MKNVSVCADIRGLFAGQSARYEIQMDLAVESVPFTTYVRICSFRNRWQWPIYGLQRSSLSHNGASREIHLTWWLWLQIIVDGGSGAYLT